MPVSFAGTTGASMHGAIIPIATTTLATATTTVTFSNIPQGYQDLMLVINTGATTTSSSGTSLSLLLNGDTAYNYSSTWFYGQSSSANSGSIAKTYQNQAQVGFYYYGWMYGTSSPSVTSVNNILNYANTSTYKNILSNTIQQPAGTTRAETDYVSTLYSSTNAVTSIVIQYTGTYPMMAGSVISLYGVRSVGQ